MLDKRYVLNKYFNKELPGDYRLAARRLDEQPGNRES